MRSTWVRAVGRVLVWLVVIAVVVALSFGVLLLLLGRVPTGGETGVLAAAVVAMLFGAVLIAATAPRVSRFARRVTEGDSVGATDLARSFGSRMSRSVPLDELVLQAVEGLRSSMRLRSAETWLLADDALRPWIGEPDIDRPSLPLNGTEPATIVQAGLSGHGWLQVWLPQVLERREQLHVRLAPMANSGELLGVVIVDRPLEDRPFTRDEERVIVELARQLGVMVHNAQLDSALRASLDEVRRQAAELQASRGRIVAATDEARRRIERDLHDGAQQHIVALAVRVRLAEQLMERDPQKAREALVDIGHAIDDTLQELRDLAHGIYPPLLVDKGLPAALSSAARRAVVPVTVRADGLGRYPSDAEATVYFCVLEALQNAGKYAGESAHVTVEVREESQSLVFEVRDDGVGFDVRAGAPHGAGFTNMLDRLGALRGTLRVESAPGRGTQIRGTVPVEPAG